MKRDVAQFATITACMVLLTAVAGCGNSHRLETAPVRGQVTLDGSPYTHGGSVMFQPEASGKMAVGQIQSDGSYELTTYSPGDGAVVGKHRAIVLPPVDGNEEPNERAISSAMPSRVPEKYGVTSTSGLVCEVLSGQANEFPIEMHSK